MVRPKYIMKDFEIPTKDGLEILEETKTYAKYAVGPYMPGFGTTIGNILRRTLLSSIIGAAVTSIKFKGVKHEFSSIDNVREDVAEIILNIKQLAIKMEESRPVVLKINKQGPGELKASDIECPEGVEIINKELVIANIDEVGKIEGELEVNIGRGYKIAELTEKQSEIGKVEIDAMFSPIRRAAYSIEETRFKEHHDYDKLILEIWTNGTIAARDAMAYAAKIVKDHMYLFINFEEEDEETTEVFELTPEEQRFFEIISMNVDELELSVRAQNCLHGAKIKAINELIVRTENEMLKTKNFGTKSLDEIKKKLSEMNVKLGMTEEVIRVQEKARMLGLVKEEN